MAPGRELCTVVKGSCEVHGAALGALKKVSSGGFLCNLDLSRDEPVEFDSSLAAHAEVPTTAVTWEWQSLRPFLERNSELKVKFERAIATSMANSLLKAHA
uniref:Uncharacterized protein n=1 Tax=Alexandrium catenella TaxID=2925 RepID=A0A7S1RGL7_ALECA